MSARYSPIADYAAVGNLYTVALVSVDGSIDWCCLPHLDSPSVFGAILDHRRGGRFSAGPTDRSRGTQRYLPDTNVLETVFETPRGRCTVTDFMPLRGSILDPVAPPTAPQLYRVLRAERGDADFVVEWSPRFDYARGQTRIVLHDGKAIARSGEESLALAGFPPGSATMTDAGDGAVLVLRFRLPAGETVPLCTWYGSADPRWPAAEWPGALDDTVQAWREWLHTRALPEAATFAEEWQPLVDRSGLALKLLTYPDTGAIAAAATTSLPETIGGVRNWDYRFTWIRDASFTAQALTALGHPAEALDFLQFAERVCMQSGNGSRPLRVMYGLRGETNLTERELTHLEGYRESRPVRIGNAAAGQLQLDIYGELLDAAYELLRLGGSVDPGMWAFLTGVADEACERWRQPDEGIWEVRGGARHFVYSKVMIWVALDRAVRIAHQFGLPGDTGRWTRTRDAVRTAVLSEGYDAGVGAFVQAFGSKALDASNLLIPVVGFLPPDDPRVLSTIDRTLEQLTENGLVYRYRSDDGLPGHEGAFGLTTFWMVDALALSGRVDEARALFEGVVRRANHVGLFAEEFVPSTGAFLGNFPQAFTHIGLINSALYIRNAEGRAIPTSPRGSTAERLRR